MSAKSILRLFAMLGLLALLSASFILATPVAAQGTPPAQECGCRVCHEQQYYLYDAGKWYCLCKAPMTCVHCHGGDGLAKTADLAHKDMLVHPFENEAAACKNCHAQDAQRRVNEFVQRAGGNVPISMSEQPAFHTAAPQPFPAEEPRTLGFLEWLGVGVMSIVAVWMFVLWLK